MRAEIRRVIGPAEHYLVALQRLRWRDYVVENRHAVEELLFGRLAAIRPSAGFQFEGWYFVGDGRIPLDASTRPSPGAVPRSSAR